MTNENHTADTLIEHAAQLAALIEGTETSEKRGAMLLTAIGLGASQELLAALRDAPRISRRETIVLPPHRFEGLSRGRGWCRLVKRGATEWGERESGGYRVGPGYWSVGGSDGFSRKGDVKWMVKHVTVGTETWTVAE